jgi:FkbM family methyltransferase
MKNIAKQFIRYLAQRAGYDIVRYSDIGSFGISPFADVQCFLKDISQPTILDVGANVGQSVDRFLHLFPSSRIHAFEPSPSTYEKLKVHCRGQQNVTPWNLGIGSTSGMLEFIENSHSDMSSFLVPSEMSWGHVTKRTNAEVKTLDLFAKEQGIECIHLLKSDTQGYDYEVFKGARELMKANMIALIYFEFIFSDMYKNLPDFDKVFRFLLDEGFLLVSFYDIHYQKELASWTDVLFINHKFYRNRIENASL